jgi:hypothetical protein
MLRPITTSSASASSAPVAVRASAAADFSASEARASAIAASESAQSQQAGAIKADEMFRYNSYQFVYRQDVGRIVLIGQSPETGERVVQVPSEQVLRAYARTARIERQLANPHTSNSPEPAPAAPQDSGQLTKALVAAVSGDNHGSGVISVSA